MRCKFLFEINKIIDLNITFIRSILCSAITANFSTKFFNLSCTACEINAATS